VPRKGNYPVVQAIVTPLPLDWTPNQLDDGFPFIYQHLIERPIRQAATPSRTVEPSNPLDNARFATGNNLGWISLEILCLNSDSIPGIFTKAMSHWFHAVARKTRMGVPVDHKSFA
jgi:hypothetical protein